MALTPQRAGADKRIRSAVSPLRFFIAAAINVTVMRTTERHRELVADLAPERGNR